MEEVKKAIDTLDFDFLFLGNTKNNYGENIIDNLYQVNSKKRLCGLYGYLINNKNIDKIIDKTKKIDRPIDVIIEYLSYNNVFNTIIMYPNIIKHQSNYKILLTIQKMYSKNYLILALYTLANPPYVV